MNINPYTYPVCFSFPRRLNAGTGWLEHIPFGMFIVNILRPRILVELGTHMGDSYCAFCQAIDELNLETRCFAVDTWTGDPHSGLYDSEILKELRNHHDPLYGKFSRLLQSSFDQALDMFEDGSVDLLHIDGNHTYESVTHDFESWLPKMSERGVVLFHDISVRKNDFGVWKLWSEVTNKYPSFSFVHGNGLGMLAVGRNFPAELHQLLNASGEVADSIRRSFFELGRAIRLRVDAKRLIWEAENRDMGQALVEKYQELKNKVLPLNTRRRELYSWFNFNARLLIEQKWKHFIWLKFRPYQFWIMKNEPSESKLQEMQFETKLWSHRPLVSVVTPVWNPSRYALTHGLQSVLDQIYDHWELVLVDGGSKRPYVRKIIEGFALKDSRIKYFRQETNRGLASNLNEALKFASGEYVGFLNQGDTLAPFAIYEVVKILNDGEFPDILYSDEDKISKRGTRRFNPAFKSSWAPDTFLSYNYLKHFAVVKRNIIDAVGGFREGYEGAQDYDLFLRIVEKFQTIRRIPKILYHRRATQLTAALGFARKSNSLSTAKRAIAGHIKRRGLEGEVFDGIVVGSYRVKYRLKPSQSVNIIIPTRGMVPLLRQCVSSVISKTNYKHFNILIINYESSERDTLENIDSLKSESRVRILPYPHPINFSAINNYGVRSSNAEFLLFLNYNTEVLNPDWLEAMLEFAQRGDVGAVGAKLFNPNQKIQIAGKLVGSDGKTVYPHKEVTSRTWGCLDRINVIQNMSAVTAACMMVRRSVFEEVNGFEEKLAVAFNDVDLCLKIRSRDYLVVYTPYAQLYHYESVRRGRNIASEEKIRYERELSFINAKWKDVIDHGDPYHNPNLNLDSTNFGYRI